MTSAHHDPTAACDTVRDTAGVLAAIDADAAKAQQAALKAARTTWDRQSIARDPWLTADIAARLARSARAEVRHDIAQNRRTPVPALTALATDNQLQVRRAVAKNPNTPWEFVVAATDDPDILLTHPNLPAQVMTPDGLTALLGPRGDRALEDLLAHPNLPSTVLDHFVDHPPTLEYQLLDAPGLTRQQGHALLDRIARERPSSLGVAQWRWAAHPAADPDWLADLAQDRFDSHDQGTIAHIATNPSTPQHVLDRIVRSHAHRDYALANPSISADTLLFALTDPTFRSQRSDFGWNDTVRRVAANPAATPAVLEHAPVSQLLRFTGRGPWYAMLAVHATTGPQTQVALTLAPTFTGSVTDLLTTAAGIAERAA